MIQELLQKYIWLVQTFIRAGEHGLLIEDVMEKWEDRWDTPYNRRSFNNHRDAVEAIFGIRIECDRTNNLYYIASSEDVADGNDTSAWLIDTFTVNSLLSQSKDRLSGRVAVEEVPSGHRYLTAVMEAMQENHVLSISYRKYDSASASNYTIHPYAVKETARRWYLVGYCEERKGIRVYGMDRIMELNLMDRRFQLPKGFDVEELFATSYGVYLPEGMKAEEIVFRASAKEARFLTDLPLHSSQKVVSSDSESTTFSIRVCPNEHLIMDLLSHSDKIEVLSPESVREKMREEVKKMYKLYE